MTTGFVLSIIQPPEGEAAYGKAFVLDPVSTLEAITRRVAYVLNTEADTSLDDAERFGGALVGKNLGTYEGHFESGLTFRVDLADNAPHACPCEDGCGRLVLPNDHPHAHVEDAYCPGCFTWSRTVPACLPENSAHATKAHVQEFISEDRGSVL